MYTISQSSPMPSVGNGWLLCQQSAPAGSERGTRAEEGGDGDCIPISIRIEIRICDILLRYARVWAVSAPDSRGGD